MLGKIEGRRRREGQDGLTDSKQDLSLPCCYAKTGLEEGRSKGNVESSCCHLPTVQHLFPTSAAAPGGERSVPDKGVQRQPWCLCHLGRCPASCNGNPGSALDKNTRPLSASSEALLPSSCPASLEQLSPKPLSKKIRSVRVAAAETL